MSYYFWFFSHFVGDQSRENELYISAHLLNRHSGLDPESREHEVETYNSLDFIEILGCFDRIIQNFILPGFRVKPGMTKFFMLVLLFGSYKYSKFLLSVLNNSNILLNK
jgi:hypothetical protein